MGTSFKEVTIQLVRGTNSGAREDWFDHKRYIKETLPKLLTIRAPPQIKCRRFREPEKKPIKVDEDVIMYEPVPSKPRLVPQGKSKFVK